MDVPFPGFPTISSMRLGLCLVVHRSLHLGAAVAVEVVAEAVGVLLLLLLLLPVADGRGRD